MQVRFAIGSAMGHLKSNSFFSQCCGANANAANDTGSIANVVTALRLRNQKWLHRMERNAHGLGAYAARKCTEAVAAHMTDVHKHMSTIVAALANAGPVHTHTQCR